VSSGLGSVVLAISKAATWGWGATPTVVLLCAGSLLLALWVRVELRVDEPLIDLRLAQIRAVLCANVAAVLIAMGMYLALSLVNRLVQTPESFGYGFSASLLTTGLLLLPLSLGSFLSQPLARRASTRYGMRATLAGGSAICALTLVGLGLSHAALWEIAVVNLIMGLGIGSTFALMPALIVASVPAERTGSATSLNQVLRSAGGAFGSAIGVTILTAHTAAGATHPAESGFTIAFLAGGATCVLAAVATLALLPRRAAAPAHSAVFETA
jgi:MFS family permease